MAVEEAPSCHPCWDWGVSSYNRRSRGWVRQPRRKCVGFHTMGSMDTVPVNLEPRCRGALWEYQIVLSHVCKCWTYRTTDIGTVGVMLSPALVPDVCLTNLFLLAVAVVLLARKLVACVWRPP